MPIFSACSREPPIVDMFPVHRKTVDMFLTPFFAYRHGGYDYLFHTLKPCGDGMLLIPPKRQVYFSAV